MVKLSDQLSELKGFRKNFVDKLKKLNIETIKDLLWHFPFRYEDFSGFSKIADLKIGEHATIQGVISAVKLYRTWKRRMFIVEALISDDTGSVKAVWFNQRFLLSVLKKGRIVNLAGKVTESSKNSVCMSHPVHEVLNQKTISGNEETKHTGRLTPVYSETKGLTSRAIRFLIKPVLENLEEIKEFLPEEILNRHSLPEINPALRQLHFPDNPEEWKIAQKRFAFEDLFLLQLANLKQRLWLAEKKSFSFDADLEFLKKEFSRLPFELTQAQKKALWEILKDFKKPHPMNRLLQGDVGSGKTIVAALAALAIAKENKQNAFMAPTEVLARQHYATFKKFFSDFDKGVGLITGGEAIVFYGDNLETKVKKQELIKKITDNEIKIVIGTHSLIQKNFKFGDLAFVVVDEQHRFGVKQRAELLRGSARTDARTNADIKSALTLPHFLSMSATPIPRTLSLTLFGDLDLSIIDELPKNRKKIVTKAVSPSNRDKAYAFIREQIKKGRQTFVICPRIDPAEINGNLFIPETKAVKEEYEKLSQKIFPDLKVAMLHGKMKSKEKALTMKEFSEGKTDILVSTSVIEVGVDIPNATIMMIEGTECFGLAQLYQFRGRVGRGQHQSFCFLFTDSFSKTTQQRLRSLIEAKNGFELAEKDLEIRGPGEILGAAQTGVPDLAMKAIKNPELVKTARDEAVGIIEKDPELKNYPLLQKRLESFGKEIHLE
ncbi:MAG: ATP-dependent DNA helicase RecG [Patescibacteria group bacterium]